jgi:Rhodopirellula transposase DDE domain
MLGYIRGTTTAKGLIVTACLDEGTYKKGKKPSREEVEKLFLTPHPVNTSWNYTVSPAQ